MPFVFPSLAAADPVAAPALPLGALVEDYTVLQVLSEGPYGYVYLTRDTAHGATRVLKEFLPRMRSLRLADGSVRARHAGDSIASSVARLAFMHEANALAGIQQPGLVRVLGVLQAHRTLYRVMPLYDGVSLEQHCLSRADAPTLSWLGSVIDSLLQSLDALHAQGLAHGCVQPDQALVLDSGPLVLLGFGSVARELDDRQASPWGAPERDPAMRHLTPRPANDLYGLAATAYFAATGATPPTALQRSAGVALNVAERLAALVDDGGLSAQRRRGMANAIESGLSLSREARPQTVAEFRRLLDGEPLAHAVAKQPTPRWVGLLPTRDDDEQFLLSQPAPAPATTQAGMPPHAVLLSATPNPGSEERIEPHWAAAPASAAADLAAERQADVDADLHATVATEPAAGHRTGAAVDRPGKLRWRGLRLVAAAVLGIGIALVLWSLDPPATTLATTTPEVNAKAGDASALPPPAATKTLEAAIASPGASAASVANPEAATEVASATTPAPAAAAAVAQAQAPAPAPAAAAAVVIAPPAPDLAGPTATPIGQAAAISAIEPTPALKQGSTTTSRASLTRASPTAPGNTKHWRSPAVVCSSKTQFSQVYCMQQLCARAAYKSHRQCVQMRRNGKAA